MKTDDEIYEEQVNTIATMRVGCIKLRAERDALVQQRNEALDAVEQQKRVTEKVADNANRWREVATNLYHRVRFNVDENDGVPDYDADHAALDEYAALKAKENQP